MARLQNRQNRGHFHSAESFSVIPRLYSRSSKTTGGEKTLIMSYCTTYVFQFGTSAGDGQREHFFVLSDMDSTTLPEVLAELVRLSVHQAVKVHKAWWTPGAGGEPKEVGGWEFFPTNSVVQMVADNDTDDNILVIDLLFASGGEQLATLHATQCE